jgi:hypothetical protein
MKFRIALALIICASGLAYPAEQPHLLDRVTPLPMAVDSSFQFRKTKLYLLTETAPRTKGSKGQSQNQSAQSAAAATAKASRFASTLPATKTATSQDASITFERQYRMFGAVTKLDQRQRCGNYFDFFWRANRPADLTVRLEYRQEKLHAHIQAQEVSYPNARGNHKTEFRVVGDDYFDDGRVIAWRCVLIENGQIVAENRSYTWE